MPSFRDRLRASLERRRQLRQQRLAAGSTARQTNLDRRLVVNMNGKRIPSLRQLRYLPRFLDPKERAALKVLAAIFVVSLVALGAKLYDEHMTRVPAVGGDYAEAVVGTPHVVNPVLASTNDVDLDLSHLIFSGLMKTDATGALVPDLAESYTVSADGKVYTFTLKKNAVWQDGEPLTSKDVTSTIARIQDPATKSPFVSQFKNVKVDAPDDAHVVFTIDQAFAPFLASLTVGILPQHLWNDILPENTARAELSLKPIGSGPFKFRNFTKDNKGAIRAFTLVRNDGFYDQPPYLNSITFKFYSDFGSAVDALQAKQVDGMSFLPLEYRDTVDERRSVKDYTLELPQYTALFFNQKKNVLLNVKEVRKALSMSLDREKILREGTKGSGRLVNGPIPQGFLGYNADIGSYGFDPQAAGDLLDKGGWKLDPADGVRKKTDQPPTPKKRGAKAPPPVVTPLALTITTVDTKEDLAVADLVKQAWTAIGAKVDVRSIPSAKIQKDVIRARDYDVLLYGEILGADPDPYPFWHSSQSTETGLNLALYSNRRADELLEKGRSTLNQDDRVAAYKEFQTVLREDLPAIFLYSPQFSYVISKNIRGVEAATIFTPADRFADVTKWYINTKNAWR